MSALPAEAPRKLTVEEYFEIEEKAEYKSEFLDGVMYPVGGAPYMMAGGQPENSLATANLNTAVGLRLRGGGCRVYTSDLRVLIPSTGLYAYPDLTVICGQPEYTDQVRGIKVARNPAVLFEVLSPSTESYDRGGKFFHYQQIESLREYVLVSTDRARVETFTRQEDRHRWLYTVTDGREGVAVLGSIGVDLPLAEIYDGVELPPTADLPPTLAV